MTTIEIPLIIFGLSNKYLNVLLVRGRKDSQQDLWTLPMGEVQENEFLEASVQRIYCETAGLENVFLDQLCTFIYPSGDLKNQTIHILYYAMMNRNKVSIGVSESETTKWIPVTSFPNLNEMDRRYLQIALDRLQDKVRHQPIGFYQLPDEFEFSELQQVYEMILNRKLDKELFRSKLYEADLLIPLHEKGTYRFNVKRYFGLKDRGFCFNI